ncbi:MAG: carboxypeptidase regulatory-like domain-containing protein [Gemmatimonadaceae bacterium]|nr:carboxypeptidase regulatory-like domain-containing protein [Gemmatimonadaceae bacterium]
MSLASIGGLAFAASCADAQDAPRLFRVDGIAYDSLARVPLRQAFVSIVAIGRTATTDDKGRFRMDSVPEGPQLFTMQHAAFDSLGLSGMSSRVLVQRGMPRVVLAVPSFGTLWRAACGEIPAPRDSALMYGTVRDLGTQREIAGATVDASWVDLVGGGNSLASIGQRRWHRLANTDERGEYALCGVPANTALTLQAHRDSAPVTSIELTPIASRVRRLDLLVATRTGVGFARSADSVPGRATGSRPPTDSELDQSTGTVSGIVTNAAGLPLSNAAVAIDTMPEVRTGENGRFLVRHVPPGTRQAAVVVIGMQPYVVTFDVRVGDTAQLVVPMTSVQTLSAVKVKANTIVGMRERTIEDHKRLGLGTIRDSTEVGKYATMYTALTTIPFLDVRGTPGRFALSAGRVCPSFRLVLDGHPALLDQLPLIDNREVAVVEVYRRLYPSDLVIPAKCTIVVWTKAALGK